jgi:hypothetical protein
MMLYNLSGYHRPYFLGLDIPNPGRGKSMIRWYAKLVPTAPLRLHDVKRALRLKPHQIASKVAITT